jgi:hypothetical protein
MHISLPLLNQADIVSQCTPSFLASLSVLMQEVQLAGGEVVRTVHTAACGLAVVLPPVCFVSVYVLSCELGVCRCAVHKRHPRRRCRSRCRGVQRRQCLSRELASGSRIVHVRYQLCLFHLNPLHRVNSMPHVQVFRVNEACTDLFLVGSHSVDTLVIGPDGEEKVRPARYVSCICTTRS